MASHLAVGSKAGPEVRRVSKYGQVPPLSRTLALNPQAVLRDAQRRLYLGLCAEGRVVPNSQLLSVFTPQAQWQDDKKFHVYDLSENLLGAKQALPFAASIAADTVARQGFGDDAIEALCLHLQHCRHLEQLDVSGNRFSRRGAEALVQLRQQCPRLAICCQDTCLDKAMIEKRGLASDYCRLAARLAADRAPFELA